MLIKINCKTRKNFAMTTLIFKSKTREVKQTSSKVSIPPSPISAGQHKKILGIRLFLAKKNKIKVHDRNKLNRRCRVKSPTHLPRSRRNLIRHRLRIWHITCKLTTKNNKLIHNAAVIFKNWPQLCKMMQFRPTEVKNEDQI